jgi:heme A synthase
VTDITERKTTEDKVRRLVEAGILGIFFATVEGGIVEANQALFCLMTPLMSFIPPEVQALSADSTFPYFL